MSAQAVIEVARGELGVCEEPSGSLADWTKTPDSGE